MLLGRETIYRDGERVGWLVERRLRLHRRALASATATCATRRTASTATICSPGSYELEVATERVPATVFLDPLVDPAMARIKS